MLRRRNGIPPIFLWNHCETSALCQAFAKRYMATMCSCRYWTSNIAAVCSGHKAKLPLFIGALGVDAAFVGRPL